jgi:Domain of unknown function (DUF4391)
MTLALLPADVLTALRLPATALTDQRVPKKLMLEHGTPTTADRRLIEAHLDELWWHASLKPHTVGIPDFHDAAHSYPELAVLTLTLRGASPTTSKATRLYELIHRAIPYPLLLLAHLPGDTAVCVSVAHKRHSQISHEEIVLDDVPVLTHLNLPSTSHSHDAPYLHSLDITRPTRDLYTLYDAWVGAALAHAAAAITGQFRPPADAPAHRAALHQHAALEREIAGLRTAARKERSLARRAELNLKVQALTREQEAQTRHLLDLT